MYPIFDVCHDLLKYARNSYEQILHNGAHHWTAVHAVSDSEA